MICALIRAILRFERLYTKLHWQYDFFSLAFNVIFFTLFITALSSTGPESWNLPNIILVCCFFLQIPVQIWAISIVKEGLNFFNLLYVLISIAE
jgi:multisubunit Na+/H+ antiporter MnhG subunit